ncbi:MULTISPECIES: hypothetical protein [Paracoccus]|uniref:hypothetical protein n=1 Tax=Paracoccus TaxID=265 RepID=UPI00086ED043|nr:MULTISPECIES: hypothetical protein [Paracoccus]ODT61484.1 MAG: hypothetical protein ABS73_00865 [Paracoccus sp. SCN 68-21]
MRRPHDPTAPATEADRTSQTRFGPRPVPTGHRPASAPRRAASRHDDVTTSAKVVVWAGVALGVAGITAASSLLARKLAGGDDHPRPSYDRASHDRPPVAPRFATLDEEEREAMRRRVRAQSREDSAQAARLRANASRGRGGNVAQNLTRTATDLSQGLNGVAQSLAAAFQSFRGVSSQATTIVGDFVAAADQLRAILNGAPGPRPGATQDRAPRAPHDDTRI